MLLGFFNEVEKGMKKYTHLSICLKHFFSGLFLLTWMVVLVSLCPKHPRANTALSKL